jgi:hypothetical protein
MNNIVNIIASSSAGNCYIYNEEVMVDVGVSYIKIKDYLKNIKLILLTHQHSQTILKTQQSKKQHTNILILNLFVVGI